MTEQEFDKLINKHLELEQEVKKSEKIFFEIADKIKAELLSIIKAKKINLGDLPYDHRWIRYNWFDYQLDFPYLEIMDDDNDCIKLIELTPELFTEEGITDYCNNIFSKIEKHIEEKNKLTEHQKQIRIKQLEETLEKLKAGD